MSQSTATRQSRRPTLGLVAQIAGVIGAILCIAAIVVVLTGRTWVQQRVDVLQGSAVEALDQALAVSDQAIEGLSAGSQQAAEIRTAAEGLAANPALDEKALSALQERLAPLSERYSNARERYVTLREKAGNLIDTVGRLERIVPGLEIPDGPTDLVNRIDEGLTNLDQAVTDLSGKAASRVGATEIATSIAAGAARLEEGLGNATQLATNIQTNISEMQDSVTGVAGRLESWLTYGAIAVALLFAWILVLNLALVALGRRWRAAA